MFARLNRKTVSAETVKSSESFGRYIGMGIALAIITRSRSK